MRTDLDVDDPVSSDVTVRQDTCCNDCQIKGSFAVKKSYKDVVNPMRNGHGFPNLTFLLRLVFPIVHKSSSRTWPVIRHTVRREILSSRDDNRSRWDVFNLLSRDTVRLLTLNRRFKISKPTRKSKKSF